MWTMWPTRVRCSCSAGRGGRCTPSPRAGRSRSTRFTQGWSSCWTSRQGAKSIPARYAARRGRTWWVMPRSCARRGVGPPAAPSTISCETSSMPKRTDLHRILLIGSGPIVIGQGAEFDYSGTQAVKALKEEGYEVVLVNSNPATIMTDPEIADRTYIEPVTPEWVRKVIERERPDALLPTMGGQAALNVASGVARDGTLAEFGVELIGASARAIQMAEDRAEFATAMRRIGLAVPLGRTVASLDAGLEAVAEVGYPAVIRPSFTLGGTGGGIAYNREEFEELVGRALELSPVHTTLIERGVLGWKEFELEVMRDGRDNVVIVCSIENLDPMGVHTGDSITVAPAMTLTDREYQRMRDAAIAIIREIGVAAGG